MGTPDGRSAVAPHGLVLGLVVLLGVSGAGCDGVVDEGPAGGASTPATTMAPSSTAAPSGSMAPPTSVPHTATSLSTESASRRSAATPARLHESVDEWPAGTVVVDTGSQQLHVGVRIAATASRRAHGLMEVPEVPAGTGMWFIHPDDTTGGYWMQGTLVDLDIAWVDANDEIVAIETMQVCEASPCPSYRPDATYRSALEVRAGWLSAHGVEVGDSIRLLGSRSSRRLAQRPGTARGSVLVVLVGFRS